MRIEWTLCFLVIVGCDGGRGAVSFEELPAELASAACRAYADCDVRYPLPAEWTGEGCTEYVGAFYESSILFPIAEAIDRGTIVYDAAAATECLRGYEALGCELYGAGVSPQYAEACARMFVGQIADGEACSLDTECQSTSYCGGAACPGTCAPRTPAGQACTDATECELGYYCREDTCQELVPERASDGACMLGDALGCAYDEVCIGASAGTPGQCTPIAEVRTQGAGETCNTNPEQGQLCQAGLTCALVGAGGVFECRAAAATDGPCFGAIPSMCPPTQHCAIDSAGGTLEGLCTDVGDEGDACSSTAPCGFLLVCSSSVCVAIGDNGEPCADDSECYSRRCESGVCAGPSACPAP